MAEVVYSSPIVNEIPTIAVDATGEKGCGINNRFQILSLDGGMQKTSKC